MSEVEEEEEEEKEEKPKVEEVEEIPPMGRNKPRSFADKEREREKQHLERKMKKIKVEGSNTQSTLCEHIANTLQTVCSRCCLCCFVCSVCTVEAKAAAKPSVAEECLEMIEECDQIYRSLGRVEPNMEKVRLDTIAALQQLGEQDLEQLSLPELFIRASNCQRSNRLLKSCILFVKAQLGSIFVRMREEDKKLNYDTISERMDISRGEISYCVKFHELCVGYPPLLYSTKSWTWIRNKLPKKMMSGQINTFLIMQQKMKQ